MTSETSPFDERIISAVEKIGPSVVNVGTVLMIQHQFHVQPISGMGSGVITDSNGLIITNRHVVAKARKMTISTADGQKFTARVLGADANTDVAVLKVDAEGLPAAELGDSDKLKVGQLAIAIGNPFGLVLGGPTVTTGVISALNRHIQTKDRVFENLIQTDAAINPGNSGGPLVDTRGKVIGINTAMIPYAQGIGFAIPIDTVRKVAEEIIAYGRVVRPWLGLVGISITKRLAYQYNLPSEAGVAVARVIPNSPVDRGGISEGDVIVEVDGVEVKSMEDLQREISKKKVGETVDMVLIRGVRRGVAKVVLGETPQP
ncbi:MAG: PDZ domain-containing protein [Nitrososphaeria archaeon]|nr:PDZ domain-containing protein [Nitrososphaeria archaeon]NIN52354.1 PDZ domain-containing protein [Nitrososphaeria archaeon]NIQ32832.1 PDZ domain-containing protein [Nitrososphaeria archaeon]